MPTTRAPIRSSTPRCSSSLAAFADSWSPKVASGSLPPSSKMTRTDDGSNVAELTPEAAARQVPDLARPARPRSGRRRRWRP